MVDTVYLLARLLQAREFHDSARSLVTLFQSKSYNGATTLMVSAAIAYGDAVTARTKGCSQGAALRTDTLNLTWC